MQKKCPCCHGKRLNAHTLSCKVDGKSINEMCELEFASLREELLKIEDKRVATIVHDMVGLSYADFDGHNLVIV